MAELSGSLYEADAPAVDGSLDGVNPDQAEATGVVTDIGFGAGPARKVEPDYQWDADPEFAQMPGSMKRFAESGQNAVELGGEAAQKQLSARDEQIAAGEKFIGETEARMAELSAHRAAAKEENRQRIKDLENQNSIADAYYKDKANRAEWNSLISRFFGSFYAAVGKPELAVKNAENAIREEMQAKEHAFNIAQAGIGRKQTLYGLYKQQYQDDDQAALALEIDTRAIAAQKLSLIAEKTNSPAMAKAAEALLEKNRSAMALQENLLFRSSRDYHATPEMMAKHAPKMGADSVPSKEQDANINVLKKDTAAPKPPTPPTGAAPLGALSGQGGRMASPPERTQPSQATPGRQNWVERDAPGSAFMGKPNGAVYPNAQYGKDREQVTATGERFLPLTGKDVPEGIRQGFQKHPGKTITPEGTFPLDAGNGRFFLVPEHRKDVFDVREAQKIIATKVPEIQSKLDRADKLVKAYGAWELSKTSMTTPEEAKKGDDYAKARKEYISLVQQIKADVGQTAVLGTKILDKGAIKEGEIERTMAGLNLEDIGSRFGTVKHAINGEDQLRLRATLDSINNMAFQKFNSSLTGLVPARRFTSPNGGYGYWPLQNAGNYGNVLPDNRVQSMPTKPSKK
jgi:hypothetical protein